MSSSTVKVISELSLSEYLELRKKAEHPKLKKYEHKCLGFLLVLKNSIQRDGPMTRIIGTVVYSTLQVWRQMLYTGHLTDGKVFQSLPLWVGFKPMTPEVRGCTSNYRFPLSLSVKMPKAIYCIYI